MTLGRGEKEEEQRKQKRKQEERRRRDRREREERGRSEGGREGRRENKVVYNKISEEILKPVFLHLRNVDFFQDCAAWGPLLYSVLASECGFSLAPAGLTFRRVEALCEWHFL